MQRIWVHNDEKLLASLYGVRRSVSATADCSPGYSRLFFRMAAIGVFLCSALAAAVVMTAWFDGELESSLRVIGVEQEWAPVKVRGPVSRSQYLTWLTANWQRAVASQVHYVSEIIRRSKKVGDDGAKLARLIVSLSAELNYDPLLVAAVIKSESLFDHKARSSVGAQGLMQIMPETLSYLVDRLDKESRKTGNLSDPAYNIRLGIIYLKYLEKLFNGNKHQALIAYNWGPGNMQRALRKSKRVPASSATYARGVLSDHRRWSSEFSANIQQLGYVKVG